MAEQKEKAMAKTDQGRVVEAARDTIVPPVDIYEDGDLVTLFADLPGVSKENLEVQIDKDTLKITGKRATANETATQVYYDEIPYRDYYRAFTIGEEIDREKITASMNNGVLKLTLPKHEKSKPKRIEIKVA
jgi:HSP20 family molecular chaperone IbpA